jgi:hypothetical protein
MKKLLNSARNRILLAMGITGLIFVGMLLAPSVVGYVIMFVVLTGLISILLNLIGVLLP